MREGSGVTQIETADAFQSDRILPAASTDARMSQNTTNAGNDRLRRLAFFLGLDCWYGSLGL